MPEVPPLPRPRGDIEASCDRLLRSTDEMASNAVVAVLAKHRYAVRPIAAIADSPCHRSGWDSLQRTKFRRMPEHMPLLAPLHG